MEEELSHDFSARWIADSHMQSTWSPSLCSDGKLEQRTSKGHGDVCRSPAEQGKYYVAGIRVSS